MKLHKTALAVLAFTLAASQANANLKDELKKQQPKTEKINRKKIFLGGAIIAGVGIAGSCTLYVLSKISKISLWNISKPME